MLTDTASPIEQTSGPVVGQPIQTLVDARGQVLEPRATRDWSRR